MYPFKLQQWQHLFQLVHLLGKLLRFHQLHESKQLFSVIVQIRAACERAARPRDALTERDAANAEVERVYIS